MIVIDSDHIPPSVNNLFVNVPGRGRVPSKAYLAWRKSAGWDYNGVGSVSGRYSMVITLDQTKVRKNSDITNRIKAVEDMCVIHQIVEDDSLCQELTIRYGSCPKSLRVEISPSLV